jgi:hypothetical protein
MTDTITLPRSAVAGALYALDISQALLESAQSIHHTTVLEEYKSLRAALAQQAEQVQCEWTQDPDYELGDTYHSSCGELWSFIDGGPKDNRVSYCHHCGKSVKLAAAPKEHHD